jgi:hypothetical protein
MSSPDPRPDGAIEGDSTTLAAAAGTALAKKIGAELVKRTMSHRRNENDGTTDTGGRIHE